MHETASFVVKPETSPERQEFYERLDRVDTAPLWEVLNRLVLPQPQPAIVPALWKYDEVRALLREAGGPLPVQEAEPPRLLPPNPGRPRPAQHPQSRPAAR